MSEHPVLGQFEAYRAEGFGTGIDGEEPPFWVPVDAPDGSQRTKADAEKIVVGFWGQLEPGWSFDVRRASLFVGRNEHGDFTIRRHEADLTGPHIGPVDFWEFDICDEVESALLEHSTEGGDHV